MSKLRIQTLVSLLPHTNSGKRISLKNTSGGDRFEATLTGSTVEL
jgi:hypothetical protein